MMGKSYLRRLAKIFLLLASVLLGVYLALPLWLPSLVRAQLAPGWQLESLEFDYPISFDLHLNNIELSGNPGGIGVHIAARDLDINIHRLSVDTSSVEVDIAFADPGSKTDFFTLNDLTVPLIFRPGNLPRISIDSLSLNLQSGGMAGRSLLFTKLLLDRNQTAQSWLKTSLSLPGTSNLTGQIEISILHDSLEANLQLYLPDHSKELQIAFRQSGKDKKISSELVGQAHLQVLQPLLMAVLPGMDSPLGQLESIQGRATFEAYFTGSDQQILDHAKLSAQDVIVGLGSGSLGVDMILEVKTEADRVLINFPAPGKFRFSDNNNRISGLLDELLPVTRNKANSTAGVNDNLLLTIEPLSEIRLQTGARPAGEFTGAAAVEFSSALFDLALEVAPDAQIRMADFINPQSLSGLGTVAIDLESRQALAFETMASSSLPMGASLQASGFLEFDGQTIRFTKSTGFHALIPKLTARFDMENTATGNKVSGNTSTELDFHGLEFSGTAAFSLPVTSSADTVEFRYRGSTQSNKARISQSGSGQASQTLIDAETISLQLDFSRSGDQLHTTGAGVLRNVQMPSSAMSASRLELQWNEVDPLAVTGNFQTHTQGLVFRDEEDIYQGVDLDVTYSLLPDARVEGQGDLLLAGDLRTPVRFSGGLDSGDWVIDILPSQVSLRQAVKALEPAIGSIPGQIELGSGTIDVEGSLSLGIDIHGDMNISGVALDFSLGESTVAGADFNISGKLNETLSGKGWFSIDRIELAVGLDLLQTRVAIGLLTPETIELNNLQAEFFGGQLTADHVRLSPDGLSDTQIKMTDIDLGQVLEYIDVGGLSGTGKLTISLPAGSKGSSLYVQNGVFRANGPGVLSYSEALSATPAENIGLSALENFHYSELDGTIDYNPDGSYELMVHLAGSNPDLYDGYPIALNLNIGGMLPEAFEVLFLTGDFDKAILSRIRQEKVN